VVQGVGAYIMGRRMFGGGDGAWDESWTGWWGEDPPYHVPVFVLTHEKSSNTVQRQRFRAEEVDDVLEEVRSLLRARGRVRTQWEIGSSAGPTDLVDLLLARGLVRGHDPYAVALVLTAQPPAPPPAVFARRVETFEEYTSANEVQWEAFDSSPEEIAEQRGALRAGWDESPNMMHVAWLDGAIVCAGTAAPTRHGLLLFGGATRPGARRRGAYQALVRARWEEAVVRGTPTLITQGGAMSRPILERLGFQPVGHVHSLLDEFGDRAR
jgi:hypothetical protein